MLNWVEKILESRRRNLIEDALKHLYECAWQGSGSTAKSVERALGLSERKAGILLQRMRTKGLLVISESGLRMTPTGERLALQVIRAHRLWEKYLADEARVPLSQIHAIADRREHRCSPEAMSELDAAMGYPATDPHGDPIPTAEGEIRRTETEPLTQWPIDQPAVIVHLEDEPTAIYSQIVAEGLRLGQRIRVIESTSQRIVFVDNHETHVLSPVIAGNVFLAGCEPVVGESVSTRLTTLQPGSSARVCGLDSSLQGYTRRRLLDLGLTRGARIAAEYRSFLGDPVAYRVRGALIALRRDQAEHVLIESENEQAGNHV